jgi:hypothetical protein
MVRSWIGLAGRLSPALLGVTVAGALVFSPAARTEPDPAPPAEASPKPAAGRVTQVTVYPEGALVTREVDVPARAGTAELVVSPLPQHTVPNSLYSEGSEGVRVLATRFRNRPVKEDTREEVRKLEDELKKLRQTEQRLQAELKAGEQNWTLLGKLETFTSVSTRESAAKGKLDSDAAIALAKYVMEGRGAKAREAVGLQQQLQAAGEQAQFVEAKLKELTAGTSRTEHDAVIVVEKAEGGAGKVRLNYLVDAAGWRPQYKLRAGKGAKDPVQVERLAAIVQQSGEDWQGVSLFLSTAQPMLNASPPELKTLSVAVVPGDDAPPGTERRTGVPTPPGMGGNLGQVGALGVGGALGAIGSPGTALGAVGGLGALGGFSGGGAAGIAGSNALGGVNPFTGAVPNPAGLATAGELGELTRQLRRQARQELNQRKESGANEILNYAGTLEQAGDLALADEGAKPAAKNAPDRAKRNEGPSLTYHVGSKLTVPSRADEQVVEVARIEMAPEYFYKAVPVLTPHVYRQATLTNKSRYVLLPGEATVYSGSDFVGRMNLPLVAVGEQFTAGFGTEPQLQVHRQLVEKSRAMQGGNQILRYEYRILAASYKPERVRLQVWDRMPQAENETMGVSLVRSSPEVSKDPLYLRERRPRNLLRWDLDLEPDANGEKAQEVRYEFKLELDRQMTFGSFQSK